MKYGELIQVLMRMLMEKPVVAAMPTRQEAPPQHLMQQEQQHFESEDAAAAALTCVCPLSHTTCCCVTRILHSTRTVSFRTLLFRHIEDTYCFAACNQRNSIISGSADGVAANAPQACTGTKAKSIAAPPTLL